MNIVKINKFSLTLAITLIVGCSSLANADWTVTPVLKAGAESDDNARLDARTDLEVDLSGYLLEASADFYYETERTTFSVEPRFLARFYSDDEAFDSDDLFLRSAYNHQMQSSALGFRVSYDNQAVRTAELSDTDLELEDPDEIDGVESGVVRITGDRQKLRFVPSWSYDFSDVSSVGLELNYYDVSYSDVPQGTLTDYTDTRLDMRYSRALSERTSFLATVGGRKFDADDPTRDGITGVAGLIGLNTAISETTRLRANIGVEDTEDPNIDLDPNVIGDITLTRRLETIQMFAQYRRSISGSGGAQVTLRDQINVNFSRRLNEKVSVGLGVRAYDIRNVDSNVSSPNERDYVQLRAQFIWYLNPSFSIDTSYRYTVIDRGAALDGAANSNRINLWFVYQPNVGQGR